MWEVVFDWLGREEERCCCSWSSGVGVCGDGLLRRWVVLGRIERASSRYTVSSCDDWLIGD